jgi:hypothetical protein
LVTVTAQLLNSPGRPTAFSWLVEVSSVAPTGVGVPSPVLIDSASSTA